MTISITGIGWVTVDGCGQGRSDADFVRRRGTLERLRRKDVFVESYQRFGRLDEFSKVGLAAIAFALRDADREEWEQKRPIGVIAATEFGCLHTDHEYYHTVIPQDGLLASPNLFAYTLPNCFLGEAAIRFGLTGPSYVINDDQPGALTVLEVAADTLAQGDCDAVLAGVGNPSTREAMGLEPVTPPGAVFVLLEPGGRGAALTVDGRVCVAGQPCESWEDVVRLGRKEL